VILWATGGESIRSASHEPIEMWLDTSGNSLVARPDLMVQKGQTVENQKQVE
jgi:hypothetical protein